MDNLTSKIIQSIDSSFEEVKDPLAVFDADGTLWAEDIGFSFFEFQVREIWKTPDFLKKAEDIYTHNPKQSCAYIVQLNKGMSISEYRQLCLEYLKLYKLSLFSFQLELMDYLSKKGVKIYIVTASSEWLVQEVVKHYKLPVKDVVGVRTLIKENKITDEIEHPISFGEGKTEAFLNRSKRILPFFASGNTLSDLELLKISSHHRFSIASAKPDEKQYQSERALLDISKKNSWFYKDCLEES